MIKKREHRQASVSKRKGQSFGYFSKFFLWANGFFFSKKKNTGKKKSNSSKFFLWATLHLSFRKRRGQSSIIDAFLFIMICSSAAVLMIYTAGLYGLNNSKQINMAYNYEFVSNALLSLHYAQDSHNSFFWDKLGEKLGCSTSPCDVKTNVQSYLGGDGGFVYGNLSAYSPSSHFCLAFSGSYDFYCCSNPSSFSCSDDLPSDYDNFKTTFSSSSNLKTPEGDDWTVSLKLYY